jgi:uncharacterized protein
MLKVDLGTLARQHRLRVDIDVPADDDVWAALPWYFERPVNLELDIQQAGADVVVRGRLRGSATLTCRRCLTRVGHELDEDLTLVYQAGLAEVDAEASEVYALPAKGNELDLGPAVREHAVLAVPQFVICEEACRGFCARCGTNLNQASCDCFDEEPDPRWAVLRQTRAE